MTFTLPVSGTNPKIATKEGLEAAVNAAIGAVAASGVTGFPYFANTTLGIAGTVDGEGFTTSDGASMFFYLNNSGTADLLAEVGTPLADSRIDAVEADLLALNGRVMGSFSEAESTEFGDFVEVVWVKFDGLLLAFQPDDSGTCWEDSAGQTFSPLGSLPTFIQHWKVATNATKELSRSAVDAMTSGQRTAHQTALVSAHLYTEGDLILNGWVEILDEIIIGQRCVPVVIDGIAGEALSCGFFATSRYNTSANSVFTAGATGGGSYAPYVKSMSIALDQSEAETAGQIAYNVAIASDPADIAAAIADSNVAFASALINYPTPFLGKEAFGVVDSMRITGMPNPATWQAPTFGATNDDNIGGWEVKNLQLSGFNTDLLVENGFHFFKLGRVDDWIWDLGDRAQDYRNRDVTTGVKREAIYFGRLDSLIADHIGIFQGGQIVYDKGEGNSITDQFGTIQLDGDGASLTLRSGRSQIGMLYGTEDVSVPSLGNKVLCQAGTHIIATGSLIGDADALIEVTGGRLEYDGIIRNTNINGHGGLVTGGQLIFDGTHFVVGVEGGATPFTYLNWQVGYLQQSGTGELVVKANCTAEAFLSGSVQGGSTLEPWQFTKVLNNNTGCNIEPSPRTRDEMVLALSGVAYCLFPIKGSRVYMLDGFEYLGNSTATGIPDLLGLEPIGDGTVLHFGAVGDCTGVGVGTDDTAAIQAALTWSSAAQHRGMIFNEGRRFRMSGSVVANYGGGFSGGIIMKSPITPDAQAGNAIEIRHAKGGKYDLWVNGGGIDALYSDTDPAGGSQAFVMRGVRESEIWITGYNYKGRVYRLKESAVGEHKTSKNLFHKIMTGDSRPTADFNCGQPFLMETNASSFGTVNNIQTFSDKYGFRFLNCTDVSIVHAEGLTRAETGWIFEGCQSLWCGTLSNGDETNSITAIKILPSSTKQATNIGIDKVFVIGAAVGIHLEDIKPQPGIYIGSIFSKSNTIGLLADNIDNATIRLASDEDDKPLVLTGSSGYNSIDLNIVDANELAVNVTNLVGNGNRLSGFVRNGNRDNTSGVPLISLDTTQPILLNNLDLQSNQVSFLIETVASNFVRWIGGRGVNTSGPIYNIAPRVLQIEDSTNSALVANNVSYGAVITGATDASFRSIDPIGEHIKTSNGGEDRFTVNGDGDISRMMSSLVTITASATVSDETTAVSVTATGVTLTMPPVATTENKMVFVRNASTGDLTINRGNGQTYTQASDVGSIYINRDGANWYRLVDGAMPIENIVEGDSNTNGAYVRFADGTQICWNNLFATANGVAAVWTFPVPFFIGVERPAVLATGRYNQARIITAVPVGTGGTSASIYSFDTSGGSSVSPDAALNATGRWK